MKDKPSEWIAISDLMAGEINSLNAGVAAAIVLFEAVRQRSL